MEKLNCRGVWGAVSPTSVFWKNQRGIHRTPRTAHGGELGSPPVSSQSSCFLDSLPLAIFVVELLHDVTQLLLQSLS